MISSADPVRVFQDFATLDLISGGRAEIMAGRGSFTESFPLFGLDLEDYDELFAEKLELLLALRDPERVTWSGRHRPALHDVAVYPRPLQKPLPVWIAVGGTPASVGARGTLGLPLMIAIIGGAPARFAPLVDLYRRAVAQGGERGCRGSRGRPVRPGRRTGSLPRGRRGRAGQPAGPRHPPPPRGPRSGSTPTPTSPPPPSGRQTSTSRRTPRS